jgi:aminocarboxymuconate-semialdehyde decarboxylase
MAVIDVHAHMLTEEYLAFLSANSGPKYERKPTKAGQDSLFMLGAPFMTLMPEMWDYDARIRDMDKAGVDIAVVSLGTPEMHLDEYGLVPPVGFMFDTTLAIVRMIFDGFFDRYPNIKIIAAHGGATLPYIAGRLDRCHEMIAACSEVIKEEPSSYLQRIYYDAVVYAQDALDFCIKVGGPDNVLYGSDYPHNIGDMAGCLSRVNALDSSTAAKVRDGNAMRIFNL